MTWNLELGRPGTGAALLACPMAERRWRSGERGDARPAWAYKLVSMGNPLEPDVEARANAFGRQGWELVTIDAGVWIFKRQDGQAADAETTEAVARQEVEEAITVTDVRVAVPVFTTPVAPGTATAP